MKSSAILVNTSRGSVVNLNDLVQALQNGVIAGAALDVLPEEPTGSRPSIVFITERDLIAA